jgi:hypothetical protein
VYELASASATLSCNEIKQQLLESVYIRSKKVSTTCGLGLAVKEIRPFLRFDSRKLADKAMAIKGEWSQFSSDESTWPQKPHILITGGNG